MVGPQFYPQILYLNGMLLQGRKHGSSRHLLCLIGAGRRQYHSALPYLIRILCHSANNVRVQRVISSLRVATLLRYHRDHPRAYLGVHRQIVPSHVPNGLRYQATRPRTFPHRVLRHLPRLLSFASARLHLVRRGGVLVRIVIAMGRMATYIGVQIAPNPTNFLRVILRQVKGVMVRRRSRVLLIRSRSRDQHHRSSTRLITRRHVLINGLLINVRLSIRERHLVTITHRFYDRFLNAPYAQRMRGNQATKLYRRLPRLNVLVLIHLNVRRQVIRVHSQDHENGRLRVRIRHPLRVVAGVLCRLLFNHHHRAKCQCQIATSLLLLMLLGGLTSVRVVRPRILPPKERAVHLVSGRSRRVTRRRGPLSNFQTRRLQNSVRRKDVSLLRPLGKGHPHGEVRRSISNRNVHGSLIDRVIRLIFRR